MAFIHDQQVVQTFLPHPAHPPFRVGIGVRRAIGRENGLDPFRRKHHIIVGRKLRITVMHHKAHLLSFLLEFPQQLPRLLPHPGRCRLQCAASHMDPAGADLDKEEYIQRFQPQCFHRKEITRQQLLLVLARDAARQVLLCWTR